MIKTGDMVDVHSTIGGLAISKHHIVKTISRQPNNFGYDVAWITGMTGCVAIEALTPSKWDEVWLEDLGLDTGALDKIAAEDLNQRGIWGNQMHHTHRWNTILGEEVGELAKAILEENLEEIEKEGIQVATLALKISHMAKKLREQRKESDNGKEA